MPRKKRRRSTLGKDLFGLSKGIAGSGLTLTLGSTSVERLPSSAATPGIQRGFTSASGFLPPLAAVGGAGIVLKQTSKLEQIKY